MRRALGVVVVVVALALGACESDQDPGIEVDDGTPSTTSDLLAPCPPGGPDATTPAAGCLDETGRVVRP